MERALAMGGQNCCVTFKSRKEFTKQDQKQQRFIIALAMLFVFSLTITIIMVSGNAKNTKVIVSDASSMNSSN